MTTTETRPDTAAARTETSCRRRINALHCELDAAELGGATVVRIEHVRSIIRPANARQNDETHSG